MIGFPKFAWPRRRGALLAVPVLLAIAIGLGAGCAWLERSDEGWLTKEPTSGEWLAERYGRK